MTLDEFYAKRKEKQLAEAVAYANAYYARFGKEVPTEKLDEYFVLFSTRKDSEFSAYKIGLMGDETKTLEMLDATQSQFDSSESFLAYCKSCR